MNTQIAIGLAIIILGLLFLDSFLNNWQASIFLLKKGADLIEWLAFWR